MFSSCCCCCCYLLNRMRRQQQAWLWHWHCLWVWVWVWQGDFSHQMFFWPRLAQMPLSQGFHGLVWLGSLLKCVSEWVFSGHSKSIQHSLDTISRFCVVAWPTLWRTRITRIRTATEICEANAARKKNPEPSSLLLLLLLLFLLLYGLAFLTAVLLLLLLLLFY